MKTRISLLATFAFFALLTFPASSAVAGGKVSFIKFEASWCGNCKQMAPIFKKLSKEFRSKASFKTVDAERSKSTADKYKVTAVPTVIAVKNGRVVAKVVGYQNEKQLRSFISKRL